MTNTVTNQKSQTSYKAQKIISNVIIYAFLIFLLLLSVTRMAAMPWKHSIRSVKKNA